MELLDTFQSGNLPVSFEIFPPKGDLSFQEAVDVASGLAPLDPSFVSVTCSAGGLGNSGTTIDVARMLTERFGITSTAHLTCINATREETRARIDQMRAAGIKNVLALRGDAIKDSTASDYKYAKELIPTLRNAGFVVGAAAYPEGHIDCLDLSLSIRHLMQKQSAGAQFFVTQLCFDNEQCLRFLDRARKAGITVPITFGIMPFLSKAQISRMVFMCGASLPSPIIKLLAAYENNPDDLRKAGVEYACKQMIGLAQAGVDGVHGYIMNRPDVAVAMVKALKDAGCMN